MALCSDDFPFGIMDVVELLQIRVRRRSPDGVYVDCPLCNDRRGKMHIHTGKNIWRCNYCQESGGMLSLYARVYHISTSDAYREICDALLLDIRPKETYGKNPRDSERGLWDSRFSETQPQATRASRQEIHQTYSVLLDCLSLRPVHRAHLTSEKRGLTDEQIEKFRFKSTPPPFLCHNLTRKLISKGCTVEGVPGFYQDKNGNWTVAFSNFAAGILLPVVGFDGLIQGMQILLDNPIKDKDDPPGKSGAKYIWFSSTGKKNGTGSGSPVLLVGDPSARTVYATEGILKAYIAHAVMKRTFIASAGSNSQGQMDPTFQFLAHNGTELIVEAQDMDKYSNTAVAKSASNLHVLARKYGMEFRRLTWNANYKGIDDWQLAMRRREKRKKEEETMNFKDKFLRGLCSFDAIDDCIRAWHEKDTGGMGVARYLGLTDSEYGTLCSKGEVVLEDLLQRQRRKQHFMIYQLEFGPGTPTVPFAFKGMDALREAGYQQPPAALYRTVWDGSIICPIAWHEEEVLRQICMRYSDQMPEDYMGRPVAPSDVVELYDGVNRRYYYVDTNGYVLVRFAPALAKPMETMIERYVHKGERK